MAWTGLFWTTAGTVPGGGHGVWTLGVAMAFLYCRLDRSRLMANDVRRRVLRVVSDRPGLTAADVAREVGVHYSIVRHHLRVLESFDEVASRRIDGLDRYFVNHGSLSPIEKKVAACLEVPSRRRVLEVVARHGPCSVSFVAERVDLATSTTSHHLSRMAEDDLLDRRRVGRSVRYRLGVGVVEAMDRLT